LVARYFEPLTSPYFVAITLDVLTKKTYFQ
jgi:hypothetical protein